MFFKVMLGFSLIFNKAHLRDILFSLHHITILPRRINHQFELILKLIAPIREIHISHKET